MAEALPAQYDPRKTEPALTEWWEREGFFRVDASGRRPPFTILMPPPNVTGSLHIGHALGKTLQDTLVRWKRMQGYDALWVPGTDHAGIATQMVVERELRREGKTRHDVGREAFIERVWEWRERYGSRIEDQIRVIGASPDWDRRFFTMDERLSEAVREVFVRLYEEGLVYRADRLINWCPEDRTALSDLEVEHEEDAPAELWSFAYPLSEGEGEVVVATTRPETMLGDTAIAVHPEDERYQGLIGRTVRHPLLDREIPIVADDILVDPEFGTGAVKVTPAHDFNDFEVGERHGLEKINLLNEDGTLNEAAGPFAGLDRFEARRAVREALTELGLDRGSREHTLALGRCQRCGTIVEPLLSLQWFVRIQPLAEPAIRAVENGDTVFVPETWTKTYMRWMEDIHDWCISRQLWWGHRIPAWYGPEGSVFVARDADAAYAEARARFGPDVELRQDEDVLDTWFSSGLLPFTSLGWPEETPELKRFYPTSVLETGFDIIFFWVARMMMMGLHFMGEVPFRTVFLHAMVRDEKGEKMSKTRGNVIDPLDVTEEYGADALRFTLLSMAAQGRDIKLSMDRVAGNRAFANKIWNIARFSLSHLEEEGDGGDGGDTPGGRPELMDRWILSRAATVSRETTGALERFRFQDAAGGVYAFVWGELADWYLEMVKPRLYGDEGPESRAAARETLRTVLDIAMRLLHPMMPFVTEEIWQRLPRDGEGAPSLAVASWPEPPEAWEDAEAESAIAELQALIGAVRTLRAEYGVDPARRVSLHLSNVSPELRGTLAACERALVDLARVEAVELAPADGRIGATEVLPSGLEIFIPLEGVLDLDQERERLRREMQRIEGLLRATEGKLANASFVERAPADVVEREREKQGSFQDQKEVLDRKLQVLAG